MTMYFTRINILTKPINPFSSIYLFFVIFHVTLFLITLLHVFIPVFSYEAGKDSVLQVTRESYEKCNTTSPKASYNDGNTKVKLEQPGPVYFISGKEGHCQKSQKLRLVVVSPRSSAFSPAPSPSDGPAVAPSSGAAKLTGVFSVVGLLLGFLALF